MSLAWDQIAIRLSLALLAGFVIGFNRDEHGNPAGIRTMILVCMAATLAMLQTDLLLPLSGKTSSSFAVMDLMRNPLGILTGVGFIGAGVIVKRDNHLVTGVTTAATLWVTTVLGLLFGGGQLILGVTGTVLVTGVLWGLKLLEKAMPRTRHGILELTFAPNAPDETVLRELILQTDCEIKTWSVCYLGQDPARKVQCELRWMENASAVRSAPECVRRIRGMDGIEVLQWSDL